MSTIISLILILFSLDNLLAYSRCPNFGKLNYTCYTSDYCNASTGLVCGDGKCGRTCPDDWIKINQTCYYVSNVTKTFNEAQRFCDLYDADLVTIKDANKLKTVINLTQDLADKNIWTSAELFSYAVFKWADGTFLHRNGSWCIDQPDNFYEEFCAHLRPSYCLNDVHCSYMFSFVCEIEASSCQKATCRCHGDFYLDGKTCVPFKTYNQSCNFNSECKSSANLACINKRCLCRNDTRWYQNESKCSKCPKSWIYMNKKCYLLNKWRMPYYNSQSYCKSKSGSLLNLNDNTEFNVTIMLYNEYLKPTSVWINEINLESDACFNLGNSQPFPLMYMWCSDSSSTYSTNGYCPYLRETTGNSACISYHNCTSEWYYSICEADEFVLSSN